MIRSRTWIWAAALACALTCSNLAFADTLHGKVIAVSDGDTVTVLDGNHHTHKIRLAGIDAPEKNQPFGQQSKQHLSDLVFQADVTVEHSKVDRYGRTVGKIILNGQDVNIQQIESGLAWHYKAYEKEQSLTDRYIYMQRQSCLPESKALACGGMQIQCRLGIGGSRGVTSTSEGRNGSSETYAQHGQTGQLR